MSDKEFNVTAKSSHEKSPDYVSTASPHDAEKQDEIELGTTVQLKRRLQSRHLQMIAIGELPLGLSMTTPHEC